MGTLAKALPRWAVTDARPSRPGTARGVPTGVILCAFRDLPDYRIHSVDGGEVIAEGTAVNVKAESLRLGDFLRNQAVRAARSTQRRDRAALHHGSSADRVAPDPRSAAVGQCACPPSVLPSQTKTRQQPVDHRGRDSRRAGGVGPESFDAPASDCPTSCGRTGWVPWWSRYSAKAAGADSRPPPPRVRGGLGADRARANVGDGPISANVLPRALAPMPDRTAPCCPIPADRPPWGTDSPGVRPRPPPHGSFDRVAAARVGIGCPSVARRRARAELSPCGARRGEPGWRAKVRAEN